jgi:maleate isomerase
LSCTDMRSAETLAQLEAEIGKPVICSNQAMVFEAMQVMGFDEPIRGFGTLLERARQ